MTVLPEDQRLIAISPRAFEHPADRAATAALHAVPMLDNVVRKLIELGYERSLRQAERAIADTVEHHAGIRLREAIAR